MTQTMFKTIMLLKRRPDLSLADFIDRYETSHAKLGERVLRGRAVHYVRRYLHPVPNPDTGETIEGEHDVVTEVWYADRASWETHMAALAAAPEVMAEIVADEETLFDRSKNRFFLVEEHASRLG